MSATRRRRPRLLRVVPMSAAAVILGLWGCNPHKDQIRPDNIFSRITHQGGEVIEPRRCELRVAILDRAFRDQVINDVVWKAADEQLISPEQRRSLEVNGIKIGAITGEFPGELETVLHAPPPHNVEHARFMLQDDTHTLISTSQAVDQVSLLLNRDGRAYGKDYEAASGFLRVLVNQEGSNGVSLRISPEIHHGPLQRTFPALNDAAPYAPQQFKINDGQQEEVLSDLSVTMTLEPNQVAVIGCRPEQPRSLGAFLLSHAEAGGEQRKQKLVLIWATRNQLGILGEKSANSDRPKPRSTPVAALKSNSPIEPNAQGKRPNVQ